MKTLAIYFFAFFCFSITVTANIERSSEIKSYEINKGGCKIYKNIIYDEAPAGDNIDTSSYRTLDVYIPTILEGKKAPVFMFVHGGGFSGGDKQTTEALCLKMANEGFAVVSINYWLWLKGKKIPGTSATANMSKGLPKNGFHAEFNKAVEIASADAITALKWINKNQKRYGLDAANIVISGGSAGAMTALYTAYVANKKEVPIKAVVNLWGGMENSSLIKKKSAPLLTYHGDEDKLIHVDYASDLHNRKKELGDTLSELYILKGKGHAIYSLITAEKTAQIAEFIRKIK